MVIRTRNTQVYLGVESTPGTPGADSNLISISADATVVGHEFEKPVRDNATNRFGVPEVPVLAGHTATIEIMVPIYVAQVVRTSAGQSNSLPPFSILLKACGLTDNSSHSAVSTYTTADPTPCTIVWDQKGRRSTLTGCVGSCKINAEGGSDLMLSFTMTGRSTQIAQNVAAPTVNQVSSAYRRIRSIGAALTIASINDAGAVASETALTTSVLSFGFEQGNDVVRHGDVLAVDGKSLPQIVSVKPQITIHMLSQIESGQDQFWALLQAEVMTQFKLTLVSPDAGVSMSIKIDSASIISGEHADSDGLQSQSFTAMAVGTAANRPPIELQFSTPRRP